MEIESSAVWFWEMWLQRPDGRHRKGTGLHTVGVNGKTMSQGRNDTDSKLQLIPGYPSAFPRGKACPEPMSFPEVGCWHRSIAGTCVTPSAPKSEDIFWSTGTVSRFTLYKAWKALLSARRCGWGKSISDMKGNNKVAACSYSLVSSCQTSPLQLWTHLRHGALWVPSWALRINSSFLCTRGQQTCFQKGLNSMHFRICGPYGLCRNNQFCYKTS